MGNRKTRSDCTVGTFEKKTVYQQVQSEIKTEEIQEVINLLEQ